MTSDLDEIRAALAAATPAPWSQHVLNFVETGDCPSCEIDYSAAFGFIVVRPHLSDDGADGINDAHLVANAPTWLAALCDEAEDAAGWLRLIAKDVRGWGDLNLVRLSEDGVTTEPYTLADELELVAISPKSNGYES